MKKKYKRPVFIVVQHLRPGGIEVLTLNILEKLRGQIDIRIISLEGTEIETLENWPVLYRYKDQLHFLNKKSGLSLITVLKLMMIFIRYRPLAVHTNHIGPMLYGGLAARLSIIRNLIHTDHDGWHLKENGHLQVNAMKMLRPFIVCVANHVASCLSNQDSTQAPVVIYNGIDTKYFSEGDKEMARSYHHLPKNPRIIGCTGRMEKVKGQRYLIEALQYLPEDVHLAFAGDGSLYKTLKSYTHELGLQNRVHFLGHVNDMRNFYLSLDVFCLPSLNEGFPLSPLEAQASGIPAVLSDVGGCSETLCRDTGLLAKSGDAKDLSQKLMQSLALKVKTSPRDFILNNFDLEDMAKIYRTLYTQTKKKSEIIETREVKYV